MSPLIAGEISPRLNSLLQTALGHRILEIVAPAGYGKSLLLEILGRERSFLIGRLHLTQAPVLALFQALCEAVSPRAPRLRDLLGAAFANAVREDTVLDLAQWFALSLEHGDLKIALDDLHHLKDDWKAWECLRLLIDHPRLSSVQWALASRAPLCLPTMGWIVSGELGHPISECELKLQNEDVAIAASLLEKALSADDCANIVSLAKGWPLLGIYFLKQRDLPSHAPRLTHEARLRGVDAIVNTALATLDQSQRALLFATALLETPHVYELEAYGYGDPGTSLLSLIAAGLPLVRSSDGRFRCHDLLRECLLSRDSSEMRAEAAGLVEKLVEMGLLDTALLVAIASRCSHLIQKTVRRNLLYYLEMADSRVVHMALDRIRNDARADYAVALLLATHEIRRGNLPSALVLFQKAVQFAGKEDRSFALARLGSFYLNYTGDIAAGRRALSSALEEPAPCDLAERSEVLSTLSVGMAIAGHLKEARRFLDSAIAISTSVPSLVARAKIFQRAAFVALKDNRLDDVRFMANEAVALASRESCSEVLIKCNQLLYAVATVSEPQEALRFARISGTLSRQTMDKSNLYWSEAAEFSLLVRSGRLEEANSIQSCLLPIPPMYASRFGPTVLLAKSLLELHKGQYPEACSTLGVVDSLLQSRSVESDDVAVYGIQYQSYMALANYLCGHPERAQESAVKAAHKAASTKRKVVDCFLVPGLELAIVATAGVFAACGFPDRANSLLRQLWRESDSAYRQALARWLVGSIDGRSVEEKDACVEGGCLMGVLSRILQGPVSELTAAERRVLSAIADGKTTKEIAGALGRSPKTIEHQTSSLMRKLGVHNRVEAIAVANRRGLLERAAAT